MPTPSRVVVVGAGQAAAQFAASLRGEGFDGELIIVGDESHVPYQRPPLSKHLLAGDVGVERAYVKPADYYSGANVTLRLGERVEALDRAAKTLRLASGESLDYEQLVLATGSRVRRLTLPGLEANADRAFYLRTLDDMHALQPRLVDGAKLVVIGGGYIGLEVASVAVKKGVAVTVLEQAERLMQRVVSAEVSAFYHQVHSDAGVNLVTNTQINEITAPDAAGLCEVVCADGSRHSADLLLIGIGIEPNVELAVDAGLQVDNGIWVDADGRSSDADIFAIGDCSNTFNERYGQRVRLESVPNALGQARAAAAAVAGQAKPYNEAPWFWSDQYDLKLQIVGFTEGHDQVVVRGDPAARKFVRCYLQNGELLAAEAVNNPKDFMACRKLVAERSQLDTAKLADPDTPPPAAVSA